MVILQERAMAMGDYVDQFAVGKLIAVIGDEDTVVGFLMGGIGEWHPVHGTNFLVVDKDMDDAALAGCLRSFMKRSDVDIILITLPCAARVRAIIDAHTALFPVILEIPSKDCPYDPEKDPILVNALHVVSPDEAEEDYRS